MGSGKVTGMGRTTTQDRSLSVSAVPFINRADNVRPMAGVINELIPAGQGLVIYDPEHQMVIFYLRMPYSYAASLEVIPHDAAWVLVRVEKLEKVTRSHPDLVVVHEFAAGKLPQLVLLRSAGEAVGR